jgi:hypothetical protein
MAFLFDKGGFINTELQYSDQSSYNYVDNKKYSSTVSNQTTSTYSPSYAPIDARSLILTINSPNATTKKSDSVEGAIPSTYIKPSILPTTDLGSSDPSITSKQDAASGMGIPTNWLIIGLVGAGIFLLVRK